MLIFYICHPYLRCKLPFIVRGSYRPYKGYYVRGRPVLVFTYVAKDRSDWEYMNIPCDAYDAFIIPEECAKSAIQIYREMVAWGSRD